MNRKDKKSGKLSILAPLYIVKEEKMYFIWIVFVIIFGLLNVWAGILLGKFQDTKGAFDEGIIYTYSISILAPFLAEMLIKQIVNKRRGEPTSFLAYHIGSYAGNIILILVLTLLWLGAHKSNYILQIIFGLISSFFSFYMYCIHQMSLHKSIVGEYDDDEYLTNEKDRMNEVEKKSKKVGQIEGEKGDIKL